MDNYSVMSAVFIFSSKRDLTEVEKTDIISLFTNFSKEWKSHGEEVTAKANWIHQYFLIIEIKSPHELSGCSKDQLFRFIQELDLKYRCEFLNNMKVPLELKDGSFKFLSIAELKAIISNNSDEVKDAMIYNTSVMDRETFEADFRKPIRKSWVYQKYLALKS